MSVNGDTIPCQGLLLYIQMECQYKEYSLWGRLISDQYELRFLWGARSGSMWSLALRHAEARNTYKSLMVYSHGVVYYKISHDNWINVNLECNIAHSCSISPWCIWNRAGVFFHPFSFGCYTCFLFCVFNIEFPKPWRDRLVSVSMRSVASQWKFESALP